MANQTGNPAAQVVTIETLAPERIAELRDLIRDVPGFPHDPIVFKDITPLIADAEGFRDVIAAFAKRCGEPNGLKVDVVAGMEARGFILGAALAVELGVGFIPLRKAGKLPPPVDRVAYDLEYGHAAMELSKGTIKPGASVLIVDDVLATGGTARAAAELVESAGAKVAALLFLLELVGLGGGEKLTGYPVETILKVAA